MERRIKKTHHAKISRNCDVWSGRGRWYVIVVYQRAYTNVVFWPKLLVFHNDFSICLFICYYTFALAFNVVVSSPLILPESMQKRKSNTKKPLHTSTPPITRQIYLTFLLAAPNKSNVFLLITETRKCARHPEMVKSIPKYLHLMTVFVGRTSRTETCRKCRGKDFRETNFFPIITTVGAALFFCGFCVFR